MADQVNAVGNEGCPTGKWNVTYQQWGGVAIQADSPLLMGFVREGDIPSSLTQLLFMAMSPQCLPFPDC